MKYIVGGHLEKPASSSVMGAGTAAGGGDAPGGVSAGGADASSAGSRYRHRESAGVNISVTAPGACIALGLMYLRSGNHTIAGMLGPPGQLCCPAVPLAFSSVCARPACGRCACPRMHRWSMRDPSCAGSVSLCLQHGYSSLLLCCPPPRRHPVPGGRRASRRPHAACFMQSLGVAARN
jgi:hypothetical protein